jgi:hypothetical protein
MPALDRSCRSRPPRGRVFASKAGHLVRRRRSRVANKLAHLFDDRGSGRRIASYEPLALTGSSPSKQARWLPGSSWRPPSTLSGRAMSSSSRSSTGWRVASRTCAPGGPTDAQLISGDYITGLLIMASYKTIFGRIEHVADCAIHDEQPQFHRCFGWGDNKQIESSTAQ